jgi:hypothetical protein
MPNPAQVRWYQFSLGELILLLSVAALGATTLRYFKSTLDAWLVAGSPVSERQVVWLLVRCACMGVVLGGAIGAIRVKSLFATYAGAILGAALIVILCFMLSTIS